MIFRYGGGLLWDGNASSSLRYDALGRRTCLKDNITRFALSLSSGLLTHDSRKESEQDKKDFAARWGQRCH